MARLTPQTQVIPSLVEPQPVTIPTAWRKAERSIIRIKVNSRDPNVGVSDYSKIIPREWCGRWYLYQDNYQSMRGDIEFKSQEIYSDYQLWLAEITTQQLGQRVPLPETTQPEENLEELSEFLVLAGEGLSGLLSGLNLPFVGDVAQFVLDFFVELSSSDIFYLPTPYRPDTLYIDVPTGLVSVDVEFIWYPYSKIAVAGGLGEFGIEDEIPLPDLPDADSPVSPIPIKTFDSLAREKGYILLSECEQTVSFVFNCVIDFEYRLDGAGSWTSFSRTQALSTGSAPTLIGTVEDRSVNVGEYYPGSAFCSPNAPVTSSSLNFNSFARLLLFDGSQVLVRLAGNPSGGIVEVRNVALSSSLC